MQASSPALRIYDIMYYKRKAYHKLLEWKQHYSDKYAILLEGARRMQNYILMERCKYGWMQMTLFIYNVK